MTGTQEIVDEPHRGQKGVKAKNMVYRARVEMGMSRALHFREAAGMQEQDKSNHMSPGSLFEKRITMSTSRVW